MVIRGAPDKLMDQLMVENSTTDPTYIEDFLLTYRTFLNAPVVIADQLLDWFKVSELSKDVCGFLEKKTQVQNFVHSFCRTLNYETK